jgi:hypothetical protein
VELRARIDLLYQVFEDHSMERQKEVPVKPAQEPAGLKISANDEPPFADSGHDLEFKPCLAGNFHLRSQKEPVILAQFLDAP